MRCVFALVLMLVASAAACEPQSAQQKIGLLYAKAALSALIVEATLEVEDVAKARDAADKATKDLDEQIKPAIEAASGHGDLIAAIKAYYISAKAYFSGAVPSSGTYKVVHQATLTRLRADMESKTEALKLELDLSGLD